MWVKRNFALPFRYRFLCRTIVLLQFHYYSLTKTAVVIKSCYWFLIKTAVLYELCYSYLTTAFVSIKTCYQKTGKTSVYTRFRYRNEGKTRRMLQTCRHYPTAIFANLTSRFREVRQITVNIKSYSREQPKTSVRPLFTTSERKPKYSDRGWNTLAQENRSHFSDRVKKN